VGGEALEEPPEIMTGEFPLERFRGGFVSSAEAKPVAFGLARYVFSVGKDHHRPCVGGIMIGNYSRMPPCSPPPALRRWSDDCELPHRFVRGERRAGRSSQSPFHRRKAGGEASRKWPAADKNAKCVHWHSSPRFDRWQPVLSSPDPIPQGNDGLQRLHRGPAVVFFFRLRQVGIGNEVGMLLGRIVARSEEVLGQIECITMDMWEPYCASCHKWIPDFEAKIVLDRFHIDRHLNVAVDTVRKIEHRALQEEGIGLLAKTKWDWLYHPENLPEEREARFEETRQYDLKTVRAHAI
jgi:hypothetical protein